MTHFLSIEPGHLLFGAFMVLLVSAVFASFHHMRIAVAFASGALVLAILSGVSLGLLITGVQP